MPSTPFRVGVIGYGLSAKVFHIPFIEAEPSFKLQAIVQRSPKPGNDAAKDFPTATIHSSTDALFDDADVDVVIVGTPPGTHLPLAKQALERGKHVVVEKPFTPTAAEAQELIDVAEREGKVLAVYQNRRWDVDFLTLKRLLEEKTLGRIVDFETHFDRWSPGQKQGWKVEAAPGHGVVYDLGTHLMDQLITLFGMPKKITAFLYGQRQPNPSDYKDSCKILLHYDGFIATAQGAVVSPEAKQLRYWIRGDKGSYKKFDEDPQEKQLPAGIKVTDSNYGHQREDQNGSLQLAGDDGKISERQYPNVQPETYLAFYAQLAKALRGEGPPPVTGLDGKNVIYLCELAIESSRSGRTLDV